MQLLSQSKNKHFEKRAYGAAISKGMQTLSKRNDFLGGLAAPFASLYGGLRNVAGRAQQLPAIFKNPGATKSELLKDDLFARGAKNMRAGRTIRNRSAITNIANENKTLGYRTGRGLGTLAIGLPLTMAPFTAAKYLGAASADPELAQDYAKELAYQRVQDRLNQFSEMPFLDRIQTAWNPEKFTKQMESPEAVDVYNSMQNNDINNPGILKYLSGFHPLMGGPESVINQKVRSEALTNMTGNKEASEATKQANKLSQFYNKVLKPAYMHGKKFRGTPMGAIPPKGFRAYDPFKGNSYLEGLAGSYARNLGKHPVLTPLATLTAAYTPFGLRSDYRAGKQQVYNDAAITAEGLADLGIMEKFNQPGFMSGLGRAGMAIAPGMANDMLLNNIRQSMFPKVNQDQ